MYTLLYNMKKSRACLMRYTVRINYVYIQIYIYIYIHAVYTVWISYLPDAILHRRSKVSVQNSQAGHHDESGHIFKVVYIHQFGHYACRLSVLLLNRY